MAVKFGEAFLKARSWRLLPYRSERERKQRVGYDGFAELSGDDRYARNAAVAPSTFF